MGKKGVHLGNIPANKKMKRGKLRGVIILILTFIISSSSSKAFLDWSEFEISNFILDVEIIPKRFWLAGKAELKLCSSIQGLKSFYFYIRPTLRVISVRDDKGNELSFSQIRVRRIFPNSETSLVRINLIRKLSRREEVDITVSYSGIFYMSSDFNLKERRYNRAFSSITKEAAWLRSVQLWYPYIADKSMPLTIRATVPSGWTVISNGDLKSTEQEEGKNTFIFQEEETSSLDITLFTAPYISKSREVNDFQIVAYFFPQHRALLDSYIEKTGEIINFYTQKFGKSEGQKFAIIEIGTGYGTGTSAPFGYAISSHLINLDFPLIPHEIAHLWWGETVSDNLGKDTWLHEGLATFSDYYYRSENAPDEAGRKRVLLDLLNKAIPIGNPKTLSILEGGAKHAPEAFLVYERAAFVIQTLKHILGEEVFFKALRSYIETYRGKKADTDGFIRVFNSVSKKDLSLYFDFFLRGKKPPRYRVKFRNVGFRIAGALYQDYVPEDFTMSITLEFLTNLRSFRKEVKVKGRGERFFYNLENDERVLRVVIDPDFEVLGVRDVLEDRWEARSLRLEAARRKNFRQIKPRLFTLWNIYPDNVYILHEVAQFYFTQKMWEKGIEIYREVLGLEPNEYVFIALANIAGAYETMGMKDIQKLYLEKALAKGSSMYSIMRSLMDKLKKLERLEKREKLETK